MIKLSICYLTEEVDVLIARTGHISQDAINARDLELLIGSSAWTPKGVVRGLSATDQLPGVVNPSPQGSQKKPLGSGEIAPPSTFSHQTPHVPARFVATFLVGTRKV